MTLYLWIVAVLSIMHLAAAELASHVVYKGYLPKVYRNLFSTLLIHELSLNEYDPDNRILFGKNGQHAVKLGWFRSPFASWYIMSGLTPLGRIPRWSKLAKALNAKRAELIKEVSSR